ncbi:hypothetical protein BCF55_0527 [Hydrogenivirga caldilitoris]|uniref:DUF8082 domain-containing protein n=1 Tax=Hydrogenivirga caldilitoris TaxID=246264 RepID=A0A497XPR0_9AQUI|nr:hypothetical protein [Hydrogenivirga caldilitoris]RLJ70261.1 hypothetical protein BCF55_0527 [Hydrogenivirga caldilitoris]
MRQEVKEKINLELVNTEALIEDLRRRKFTGYVKITSWDAEDYIPFYDGEINRIFIVSKRGIEETNYTTYGFPQTGMLEIIETDPVSIVHGLRNDFNPERDGPLCLAGYGDEFHPTSSLSHIDIDQFKTLAKKSHFNGYMLFHTKREPVGMVIFYNGDPAGIFAPERSGEKAVQYIRINSRGGFVSTFLLEPDFVPLLLSMVRLEVIKEGDITEKAEMDAVRDDIKGRRMSALLYLDGGRARRYYQFFYRGKEVKGLLQGLFSIDEVSEEDVDFPGRFTLYPLYVDTNPSPVRFSLKASEEVIDRVPPQKLNEIKEALLDEMGPVAKIVWKKLFDEFGWDEESVPASKLDEFIERLAEEIPYDDHRSAFLKRVRRSRE